MTHDQAQVALSFHVFGEEAARQLAEKTGVVFSEVDLSEEALDAYCDPDDDEDDLLH